MQTPQAAPAAFLFARPTRWLCPLRIIRIGNILKTKLGLNTNIAPKNLLDEDSLDTLLDGVRKVTASQKKKKKKSEHVLVDERITYASVQAVADEVAFRPTFSASRHERAWILDFLGPFYTEQMITDVISRVKGGKEANVYCCAAFPGLGVEYVAAKIYRPRMFRSLRNDALYREGRKLIDNDGKAVKDERALYAVRRGSSYGKDLSHTSWLGHEYSTLQTLYAAGANVPKPYATRDNTILMEYLGEAYTAAPTLNEVYLESKVEARRLYERLLANVEIMLSCQRIHGDLSAYNVLYWEGEFRIIDFPQAIDPRDNRSAFNILKRDLTRLCQYFERYGIHSRPDTLARQLWNKHGYGDFWVPDDTDWDDQGAEIRE
jgi:RIO kinase 1